MPISARFLPRMMPSKAFLGQPNVGRLVPGGLCLFFLIPGVLFAAPPDLRQERAVKQLRGQNVNFTLDETLPDRPVIEIRGLTCTETNLKNLALVTTLRRFTPSHKDLADSGLAELSRLPALEELSIADCVKITDQGIAHLAGMRSLKRLNLSRLTISNESIRHLRDLTALESLEVAATNRVDGKLRMNDAGVAHLAGITRLISLNLFRSNVGGEGMARLAEFSALESLNLAETNVRLTKEAPWSTFRNLRSLNLSGCAITDGALARLADMGLLETLDLSHTDVTDAGLVHLERLSALRRLSLADTSVSGPGLQSLQRLPQLEILDLRGTKITDDHLADIATLGELRTLRLDRARIAGGLPLLHLEQLAKLERLGLADTGVSNESLRHLRRLSRLRFLSLSGTSVTAAGLKHLEGLRFEELQLARLAIKRPELMRIWKSFPMTRFTEDDYRRDSEDKP
jgi:Leucine-rich repeat (LRR) protein